MNHIQNGPIGLNDPNRRVFAGVWDTNNVASVAFDIHEWLEAWPGGALLVLVQRPGDTIPYTAQNVVVSDDLAVWTFDEVDTAFSGVGSCSLLYEIAGEIRARTEPYDLLIAPSLGPESETPPDPLQRWYDEMLEATNLAEAAQAAAEDAAGDAADSAAEAAASAASVDADELNRRILAAFPTDTASGTVASFGDGADGIPIKSAAASIQRSFVVDPNIYLAPASGSTPASCGPIISPRFRCIVFPAAPETEYTITSAITATMRAASFQTHPVPDDEPTVFIGDATGPTISITTGAADRFVVVQFLIDADPDTAALTAALGEGFGIAPAPEAWQTTRLWRAGKNLFDPDSVQTYGWTTDGDIGTNSNHRRCRFFRVEAGKTYVWQAKTAIASHLYMAWFGIDGANLGTTRLVANTTSVTATAPEGAWWASASCYMGAQSTVQFAQEDEPSAIEAFSGDTAMSDAGLTTALGANSIYAFGGTLDVVFRADPTLYIAKKLAEAGT